jgi:hypothetical protein
MVIIMRIPTCQRNLSSLLLVYRPQVGCVTAGPLYRRTTPGAAPSSAVTWVSLTMDRRVSAHMFPPIPRDLVYPDVQRVVPSRHGLHLRTTNHGMVISGMNEGLSL